MTSTPVVAIRDYTATPAHFDKGFNPSTDVWVVYCPRHESHGSFLPGGSFVGWFEKAATPRDKEKWGTLRELKRLVEEMYPSGESKVRTHA